MKCCELSHASSFLLIPVFLPKLTGFSLFATHLLKCYHVQGTQTHRHTLTHSLTLLCLWCHGSEDDFTNRLIYDKLCAYPGFAYLWPSVPLPAESEHSCKLSPSTVVNNWVSYLSCWTCKATERPPGSITNKLRPNDSLHEPKENTTVCTFAPCLRGRW